ncbi:hypothetical protein LBC_10910 [Campylobacter sp. 19-13652]|nr:hypothetical protein LBC_10910 [Campylobacter sp. 19-13652]
MLALGCGLFFTSYYIGIKAQSMFYAKLDELSRYGVLSVTMSDYDRGLFRANAQISGTLSDDIPYSLKSEISYSLLSFIFGVDSKNELSVKLKDGLSSDNKSQKASFNINLKSYISGTSEALVRIPALYSKVFEISQGVSIKSIIHANEIKILDIFAKNLKLIGDEKQLSLNGVKISLNGDFDATIFAQKSIVKNIDLDKILPDSIEARVDFVSYKNIVDEFIFDNVIFLSRQVKKRELINVNYDFNIEKIGILNDSKKFYPLKDFRISMVLKNIDLNAFLSTSLNPNLDPQISKIALIDSGFEAILERASIKNLNSLNAFLKFRLAISKNSNEAKPILNRLKFDGKLGIDAGVSEFFKVFDRFFTHKEYVFIDIIDKFVKTSGVFEKNGNEISTSFKFDKNKNDIVFGALEYELKNILF